MQFLNSIYKFFTGDDSSESSEKEKDSSYERMPPRNNYGFQHRTGHTGGGWNTGWENPVYSQSGQTSPAVSALALLGFLFFLNMIQSSLSLNRQLMTTVVVEANASASAGAGAEAGRAFVVDARGKTGGERERWGLEQLLHRLNNKNNKTNPNSIKTAVSSRPIHHHSLSQPGWGSSRPALTQLGHVPDQLENPMEVLPHEVTSLTSLALEAMDKEGDQQESINQYLRIANLLGSSHWNWRRCAQLLVCNLGQRLQSSVGRESRALLAIQLLGQHIVHSLTPRTGWANQVARALMVGYRSKKDCNKIYRQCSLLSTYDEKTSNYHPILENKKNKD